MAELIKDFDLTQVDKGVQDHDTVCTIQADQLLQHGYLEYEMAVYATAVYIENDSYYFVSSDRQKLEQFRRACYQQNSCPTPSQYFVKRHDAAGTTVSELERQYRFKVACQLQAAYPPQFFKALSDIMAGPCPNGGDSIMWEAAKQLQNCFDSNQLNLFADLIESMFYGRYLSLEGYQQLKQWLGKETRKLDEEPMCTGPYQRTYSGFAYQREAEPIQYFMDAISYQVAEKQQALRNKGYWVTPILTISYQAESYHSLKLTRERFKNDLQTYLGDDYLRLMG